MKNLKIVIAAILLFALLAGVGSAVPRAGQDVGMKDISFVDVPAARCKECHVDMPNTHHAMIGKKNTPLGCGSCHPTVSGSMYIERDCKECHKMDFAWTRNAVVNLTVLRPGTRGRPHHNITKNSSWNTATPAAYWAADRQCNNCHDSGLVASYDDSHYVPSYNGSMVTPFSTFKINATIGGGREWGGCYACHDEDASVSPAIGNPDDTHHGVRFWIGYQCNNCHVSNAYKAEPIPDYNPEPSANYYKIDVYTASAYKDVAAMFQWDNKTKIEFRNSTLGEINGTGCEKCHSVQTLHNIENNSVYNIANQVAGQGHIGNNSDCDGCHAGWVASTEDPFPGPDAVTLDSVTPGILTAGTATDVTLTGDNFVEAAYPTSVLVDGVAVAQKSITSSEIVVTIPAGIAPGGHSIIVQKGDIASALYQLSVVSPGTIASAKLTAGVITIGGSGLGADQQGVAISKADGTVVLSDSITSSTDAKIVAVSALAAVGDTVKVMTPTGEATKVIEAGTVLDSVTVTYPNAAGTWKRGTAKTVTWDRAGSSQAANVRIELLKGSVLKQTLASSTPNDGSQSVTISGSMTTGTDYKIRITSLSHTPSYTDSSDNNFAVTNK